MDGRWWNNVRSSWVKVEVYITPYLTKKGLPELVKSSSKVVANNKKAWQRYNEVRKKASVKTVF
jgi:hypothetical protein